MTSLLTNTAAMVALQTLNNINMSLNKTNNAVSTGLRIAQASDSSAYWAIATTTRSDNDALGTVRDALAIGRSTLDVTYNGLDSVRLNLQKMKELMVSARQPGVNRTNVSVELAGLITDMDPKAILPLLRYIEVPFGDHALYGRYKQPSATSNYASIELATAYKKGKVLQVSFSGTPALIKQYEPYLLGWVSQIKVMQ